MFLAASEENERRTYAANSASTGQMASPVHRVVKTFDCTLRAVLSTERKKTIKNVQSRSEQLKMRTQFQASRPDSFGSFPPSSVQGPLALCDRGMQAVAFAPI